jgi:hypothetical protein
MAESLVPVALHGATILAVLVDGLPHVSVRSLCEALGLDVQAQTRRIHRHPVLSQGVAVTATPSAGGDQQTACLPLSMLNGWLFGIQASRVRPELRERLVQYQRECFDVLARHFGAAGAAANAGQGHGGTPPQGPGATGRPEEADAPALPAPLPCIDVRTLLLTGQSDPGLPLPPELAALIDERAWAMAREAYDLARIHLQRRVAHHAQCGPANAPRLLLPLALHAVRQGTLGHALAHLYHAELQSLQIRAEAHAQGAHRLARQLTAELGRHPQAQATAVDTHAA